MSQANLILILTLLSIVAFIASLGSYAIEEINLTKLKYMSQKGNKKAEELIERLSNNRLKMSIIISNILFKTSIVLTATYLFVTYLPDFSLILALLLIISLILVFLEITPFVIAQKFSEKISIFLMPLFKILFFVWSLFTIVILIWNKLLVKVFKLEKRESISEDELLNIVDEAEQDGSINTSEGDLIRSVFDFDDLKIVDIFTPRVNLIAVELETPTQKIINAFKKSGYSRLPVYEESIDQIIGTINHKDFYNLVVLKKQKLETIIKDPVFVTEYMKVSALLALLKDHKAHMAIVKDEFGGTVGVVTMEDILEELVGDIWDEHDEIIEQITQVNAFEYRVKGTADLEDLFEILGLDLELDHTTVNGWVSEELGRIAKTGDSFEFEHLSVLVTDADNKKVIEVQIKINQKEQE